MASIPSNIPDGWGRLGAARKRRRPDPADGDYLDEKATASVRWIFLAADSISSTTASGGETIGRWLELTSTTVAPMRFAKSRSPSGGIAWSLWATRYHVGKDFQAGSPST